MPSSRYWCRVSAAGSPNVTIEIGISRPAAAAASRNRATRLATSPRARSIGIHSSAHRRRAACRADRPSRAGSAGGAAARGFGIDHTGSKSNELAVELGLVVGPAAPQRGDALLERLVALAPRDVGAVVASSSAFQPTPTPKPDAAAREEVEGGDGLGQAEHVVLERRGRRRCRPAGARWPVPPSAG